MEWENPGRQEIVVTGNFVRTEAPKISVGFAGTSRLDADTGEFVPFRPYLRLDQALRAYLDEQHHVLVEDWDDGVLERIASMEKGCRDAKQGFWHSLWHKAGSREATLNAWAGLIPDEYGLGVVRGGLAIVFMMASSSVEKRQKIFDTFVTLQEALIMAAHPEQSRFRYNSAVIDSSERLYQTVVDSTEDLFHLLATNEKSRWTKLHGRFKGSKQTQPLGPDEILERVQRSTKNYLEALDVARDHAIESAEMMGRYTGVRAMLIHQEIVDSRYQTTRLEAGVQASTEKVNALRGDIEAGVRELGLGLDEVASVSAYMRKRIDEEAVERKRAEEQHISQDEALQIMLRSGLEQVKQIVRREGLGNSNDARRALEDQRSNRNLLLKILLEKKRIQAQLIALEKRVSRTSPDGAVVSFHQFCQILGRPASRVSANEATSEELEHMYRQPGTDLDRALADRGHLSLQDQGRVQTILDNDRFLRWMSQNHPDIISVDSNLQAAALKPLSATSAFCGTLVTSLLEVYPNDVVVHFFCGLHAHPGDDWFGLSGLIRSIVMQVLAKLVEMRCGSLAFIDDRGYLRQLEEHDLHSWCATLHWLLYQFPPDTRVYCIVDSISCFDVDRQFPQLVVVMNTLREIVDNSALRCVFKVFVTTAGSSSARFKRLGSFAGVPDRLVQLAQDSLTAAEMRGEVFEKRLLRTKAPTPPCGWQL